MIYHNPWEVRTHRPGDKIHYDQPGNHMTLRLEIMVNYEMITHSISVQPWTPEDFEYVARDLVMKTQSYIFSKQYSKAVGRI